MKLEYEFIGKPEYDFTGKWQGGRRVYILIRDCFIIINGKVYKIPKGYEWDGWTIPMFIQNFFDLMQDPVPALVHDWFYVNAGLYKRITRTVADRLLRNIALDRKNQRREVLIAYRAVRILSGPIWRKYKRKNKKDKE